MRVRARAKVRVRLRVIFQMEIVVRGKYIWYG